MQPSQLPVHVPNFQRQFRAYDPPSSAPFTDGGTVQERSLLPAPSLNLSCLAPLLVTSLPWRPSSLYLQIV